MNHLLSLRMLINWNMSHLIPHAESRFVLLLLTRSILNHHLMFASFILTIFVVLLFLDLRNLDDRMIIS